jgi:hypothetical protein
MNPFTRFPWVSSFLNHDLTALNLGVHRPARHVPVARSRIPTVTEITQVEVQLQEAAVAVDAADTLIRQGQIIDLAGLESHVDTVCTDIAKLPPASCAGLKPVLIKLIDGLNKLARRIAEQHESVADKLQGLSTHRKAVTAYAADPTKPGRSRRD